MLTDDPVVRTAQPTLLFRPCAASDVWQQVQVFDGPYKGRLRSAGNITLTLAGWEQLRALLYAAGAVDRPYGDYPPDLVLGG